VRNGRLHSCGFNSLLLNKNSLFREIFSLLICVGNCTRSYCSTAGFCYGIEPLSVKIAKFPVKVPVRREFGWRRARSALRRQPAIHAFGQAPQETREWAGNPGFSRIRFRLRTPALPNLRCKSPKVSGRFRKYSRFGEIIGGDGFDQDCRPTNAVDLGH
jgi:hypothetical protein